MRSSASADTHELLTAYGEEKEYCKRLWDLGYKVVYTPQIAVKHTHSPAGRSELNRMRQGFRNSLLDAIYNDPLPILLAGIPLRFYRYWRHRKVVCSHYGISDAWRDALANSANSSQTSDPPGAAGGRSAFSPIGAGNNCERSSSIILLQLSPHEGQSISFAVVCQDGPVRMPAPFR